MKTEVIKVHPEFPDVEHILKCAKIVREGGLVIFPTETVYGIAADFNNPAAMQRLSEVKKRSPDKPYSVMISQSELIGNYTRSEDPVIYKLIQKFWPGPLTVVVNSIKEGESIGLRVPDNMIARRLVQEITSPVAAPSANFEGNPPPITCEEALKDLDGLVDIALDGGPARIGEGSTVVDLTGAKPKVLREGSIPTEEIERVVNQKNILFVCTGNSCRSVMAEYILKDKVKHRTDVEVESAGTSVFLHSTASADTIFVLEERGIDGRNHLSQPINRILLKKADLIFVMTRSHRQQVLARVPEVEKRVYLLKEFAAEPGSLIADLDIPDPMGRAYEEYKACAEVIEEAINKVVTLI